MPSKCFVPGCKTGYKSIRKENERAGVKNPCIFSAPKDDQLFQEWKQIIPREFRDFTSNDKICELHFKEECIEKVYFNLNPDGSFYPIPKGHATLKKGAIPTIFKNLPPHVSAHRKKRLSSTPHDCSSENKHKRPDNHLKNNFINNPPQLNDNLENVINNQPKSNNYLKKIIDNPTKLYDHLKNVIDNPSQLSASLENVVDVPPQTNHNSEIINYTPSQLNDNIENVMDIPVQLKDNLENVVINTPSEVDGFYKFSVKLKYMLVPSWWSVVCTEDFVMFVKWNCLYYSERRVIICKDLSIKIFLMDTQVSLPIEECTIENLSKLLKEVDNFKICKNADSRTLSGCLGFIDGVRRQMFCSNCTKALKYKKDVERRKIHRSTNPKKDYQKEIKNVKKRNKRLQNKVLQLKNKLAESKYRSSKEKALLKAIAHLPPKDQIAIKSCFFKKKSKRSRINNGDMWDLMSDDPSSDEFSEDSMTGSEELLTDNKLMGFDDDDSVTGDWDL